MCIKEELVWGMDKRFKSISIILRKAVIILRNLINCLFRPLFGDFMFFISLPRLFLLPAFFTIINNFLAKFKF